MSPHFRNVIIPLHLMLLLLITFWDPSLLWLTLLGWILISGYGAAIGLHRYFAHSAFETSKPIKYILGYLACIASQGSPIFWVAVHMHHHVASDTKTDLHSPKHNTLFQAYWGWIINLNPRDVPMKYAKRLIRDPFHKFLHEHYYKIVWMPVYFLMILDIVFFGTLAHVLFGMIIPMVISTHQEPIINVVSHLPNFGYRNFETNDDSNNSRWLSFLTFGQALHNNHHAKMSTYNYAMGKYEFDPSAVLVNLIRR